MNASTTEVKTPKTLRGIVASAKMKDTIAVVVTRFVKHPKYKKYASVSKRYLAHDPGNSAKEGDRVTIEECRPISKKKHFRLVTTV